MDAVERRLRAGIRVLAMREQARFHPRLCSGAEPGSWYSVAGRGRKVCERAEIVGVSGARKAAGDFRCANECRGARVLAGLLRMRSAVAKRGALSYGLVGRLRSPSSGGRAKAALVRLRSATERVAHSIRRPRGPCGEAGGPRPCKGGRPCGGHNRWWDAGGPEPQIPMRSGYAHRPEKRMLLRPSRFSARARAFGRW